MFCALLDQGGAENIGVNVDFFECGGDSMRAGQLVSQMRKRFAINLPATCVFVYRTVEKLAAHILPLSESLSSLSLSISLPVKTCYNVISYDFCSHVDELALKQSRSVNDNTFGAGVDLEASLQSSQRIYPDSQTRPTSLLTQAIPLIFGYPLRRVTSWFIFLQFFALFNNTLLDYPMVNFHRLIALILSLASTKVTMWVILPTLFIVFKW
jgi:hypothetical protein